MSISASFVRILLVAGMGFFLMLPVATNAQVTQTTEISADRFLVRDSEKKSEFIGNVVITQPGLKVWADRVVVNYGEGGTSDVKTFVATGNVKIQSENQVATGQRAVYRPATRILHLSGNVVVINDGGTVHSGELLVNLSSNITEFSSGGSGERVTGLFTPTN